MKATIDVKDRREADAIRTALDDQQTRAMVIAIGVLLPLSQRARQRVMAFVLDKIEDEATGDDAG